MNKHDSEDDFLNKLYQQSALEKPPVALDKQILELAKANRQRTRFAMTMNLQRVLSVAAVMVLSVYIFFAVDGDRSMSMDEDFLYPQKHDLRSSPSVLQLESLDMSGKEQMLKQYKNKEAKKSVERSMVEYETDDISELAAEAPEQSESATSESSSKFSSASMLMQQKAKTERALNSAKPEDMLKEIAFLLASKKINEAKLAYGQFKILFPEYPIPESISEAFDIEK